MSAHALKSAPRLPDYLLTPRLRLERWAVSHATSLKQALDESVAHLEPWIPWGVAEPAPIPDLENRMRAFAADFDAGRAWVYAIMTAGESRVLGGVGIYPRDATGRVPFGEADCAEIGYWLRVGATGRGYATEAVQAMLEAIGMLPGMSSVQMRCDARNAKSIAVPKRLGFHLAGSVREKAIAPGESDHEVQLWERTVPSSEG